jgi:hypothetical protein
VGPAFFDDGDFHGALQIRLNAAGRFERCTLHSDPFFAKPVFRRADAFGLPAPISHATPRPWLTNRTS